jgi:hypothetical protein
MNNPFTFILGLLSALVVTIPKDIVSSLESDALLNTDAAALKPGDTWKQCAPVESP